MTFEFEANLAVEDLKAVTGVVTSLVGTYSTITTVDIETLDAKDVNITGLAVTDIVGTAATIVTIDTEALDAFDAKITGVAVTNAVFTGITTLKIMSRQTSVMTTIFRSIMMATTLTLMMLAQAPLQSVLIR